MGDDGESNVQPRLSRSWMRWLLIGLGTTFLLLLVFHAPILRAVIHIVATRVAASQHLRLDFLLEGDPFEEITLRSVHASATGPNAVRSLDVGKVKVDYSLSDLLFHGISQTLKNVELHDASVVIDPSKASPPTPTPTPEPNEKAKLPDVFPDRVDVTNVSLTIRGQPQDLVIQNLNLGLYPNRDGRFQIGKVQIPGVHTWSNINGATSYANKNLYFRNLTIDAENQLQLFNVDTSKVGDGKLALNLHGAIGGGDITSELQLFAKGSSFDTTAKLQAHGISLGKLTQAIGRSPAELGGDVTQADVNWQGKLDEPSSWNGTIEAEMHNLRQSGLAVDQVQLGVQMGNGLATISAARIDQGNNHLLLRGSIDLPKNINGFGHTPGNFQITVEAPDLQGLTAFLRPPATGSLQATGTLKIANDTVSLDLGATGDLIGFQDAAIRKLTARIAATKKIPAPNEQRPPAIYDGLTSDVQAQLDELRYKDFAIDQVQAHVTSNGAQASLQPVTVSRRNNLLRASGSLQLPPPNEKLTDQLVELQFSLRAPQLSDFYRDEAENKITGSLQGDGQVRIRRAVASGMMTFYGQQVTAQKLVVRQMDWQATIAQNVLYLNDLNATLNDKDYVTAHGTVALQKPFHYTGSATANLADLSAFEPLLNTGGTAATPSTKTPLAGSLVLNWNGEGEAATFQNRGDLNLKLERGRYAALQNLQANVEAHYTPQELNVPIIYLGSDKLSFQAILQAKNSTLEIDKIQIDQGQAKYASAYASLPFTWSNLGSARPLFPPNGKVMLNFQSENLDLAKLFRDLGREPPVSGQLSVKLDAQGPLDQLKGDLNLQLQNIQAAAAKQLQPAKINIATHLENNALNLAGKIEQAKIQPVQIDARLPFNISDIVAKRKLDEQTPVTAKVVMPRSSINFLREFVPALRQLDGTTALNVSVGGTIAKPALSGAAEMHIVSARFENPTLPALSNFNAQLNFRENTLSFDRFGGDLAGGPFTLLGRINLLKLTEPTFDLHLVAKSILVARNDNLTARVDADIRVEGPLNAGTVKGEVLTTNSRFFKDIDIIPIGLPGRPPPHPEPPAAAPTLSFPNPPFRDWKFDVVIKSKDPFLIRGNLATGSAIVDMKVSGTGLHPQLQGQVRLSNFDATLPFSTLTINLGFLYFDPDDPFNPRIELQGTSLIRDYTIHVYVYGTANSPQAVFSSEPPLPQEEIISLLATGTTREELSGGNVLASRAAILLVKQLYRKVFKKGAQPEKNDNSFFSRLDVEFGNTDPRTGEQTATARYKLSDHWVLIGDLGVQGGFRGLVKYLIRFR
ncbi:MAG TPA: translocation/assembly module TamB domain-containing protein [Chthoniobacterales bacterium]